MDEERAYVVYNSSSVEELNNVSVEQCADFVQRYPKVHIFVGA